MIIRGKLSFEDYKNYQMNFAIPRYSIMFVILAAGCFALKFGSSLGEKFNIPPFTANIIVALLIAIIATSVLFASFFFRIRSLFNSSEAMKAEQVYETTEEGINMKSEKEEYLVKWAEIRRVSYFKTYMLIYTGKSLALLLPHSYFGSIRDLQDFKSTLDVKTSQKRKG